MRLILKIRTGKMLPQADFGCHVIVGFMQSVFNICSCSFVSTKLELCFVFNAHWGKCDSDVQLFLSSQRTDVAFHSYYVILVLGPPLQFPCRSADWFPL